MISHLGKVILFIGILLIGMLPVAHLLLANEELDYTIISELAWSPGTFDLSWKTARLALITACISAFIGWGTSALIRSSPRPYLWLAFYVLGFTISPYIAAQGWIQILGTNGSLWKCLGITSRPELLYGPYGLVFLLCLQFVPLALLVFVSTHQPMAREDRELQSLAQPPFWKRFYLFYLRRYKAPFLFSVVLIFWLAFWNYETPSILRQNTYALSVYAAFGSFYDYNQALGYLFHASVYAIPTVLIILWLTPAISSNIRSLSATPHTTSKWYWKSSILCGLCLIPLCSLAFPVIGLIMDLDNLQMLSNAFTDYSRDIQNSLIVAASASALATAMCIAFVYIGHKVNGWMVLALAAIVLLVIPPLCTGIGAVHWFAQHGEGEAGLERIVLVNGLILLPILILPASLGFSRNPDTLKDTQSLFHISAFKRLKLFLKPVYLPRLLLIFGFGFLMTLREVPASLLNYPPDGSTLALTIETMLHFDQPKLISSLCVIQLLVSVAIFSAISILIHICKR